MPNRVADRPHFQALDFTERWICWPKSRTLSRTFSFLLIVYDCCYEDHEVEF